MDPRSQESVLLQAPQSGVEPLHPLGAAPHCALAAEHVRGSHVHEGHVGYRPVGSQKPVLRENPVPGAQALQVLPPGHLTHLAPTPPEDAHPAGHLPHGLVVASSPEAVSLASDEALLASDTSASFVASTSDPGSQISTSADVLFFFRSSADNERFFADGGKRTPESQSLTIGVARASPPKLHRGCFAPFPSCCFLPRAAAAASDNAAVLFVGSAAARDERFFPLAASSAARASAHVTALRSHGDTVP